MKRNQQYYETEAIGKVFGIIVLHGCFYSEIPNPANIVSVTSSKYRVYINFRSGVVYIAIMSLSEIMLQLDPAIFYLCHNDQIINGNFVDTCRDKKRGLSLIMLFGTDKAVSVLQKKPFLIFIKPYLALRRSRRLK